MLCIVIDHIIWLCVVIAKLIASKQLGLQHFEKEWRNLRLSFGGGQILHSFTIEKFDLILYEVESFWETPFNNEPKKHADTMSVVSLNSIPYLQFSIILSM